MRKDLVPSLFMSEGARKTLEQLMHEDTDFVGVYAM